MHPIKRPGASCSCRLERISAPAVGLRTGEDDDQIERTLGGKLVVYVLRNAIRLGLKRDSGDKLHSLHLQTTLAESSVHAEAAGPISDGDRGVLPGGSTRGAHALVGWGGMLRRWLSSAEG